MQTMSQKGLAVVILLQSIIFVLLIADLVMHSRYRSEIGKLRERLAVLQQEETAEQNRSTVPAPPERAHETIRNAPAGDSDPPVGFDQLPETTERRYLSVAGRADSGSAAVLFLNGVPIGSAPVVRKSYTFRSIPLQRGRNDIAVVLTQYERSVSARIEKPVIYRPEKLALLSENVTRGDRALEQIALTFDGGSNAAHAKEILAILEDRSVPATFFLTGGFIRRYPDITRQIHRAGHETGNHTWSHPHLTSFEKNLRHDTLPGVTGSMLKSELAKTDSLFRLRTGSGLAPYWRAPYGEQNEELRMYAAEAGFRHIGWTSGDRRGESMDTRDWVSDESSELYMTAAEIKNALLNFGRGQASGANGAIVLMHLGSTREGEFLYQKLPEIIDEFRSRGYRFVTVGTMLQSMEDQAR